MLQTNFSVKFLKGHYRLYIGACTDPRIFCGVYMVFGEPVVLLCYAVPYRGNGQYPLTLCPLY